MNTQLTNTTKGSHAYAVDALTATVDQLWTEIDMNQHNVNTIASTQNQMLAQLEQAYSTHYVPSVVSASTTTSTPSSLANSAMEQQSDKLDQMFQQFLQQQINNTTRHLNSNGPTTNRNRNRDQGDPNVALRQWTFWCYSCGTNVSHNSVDCHRTKLQLPDHQKYKVTATKDNPQEGNSSKDHLW
eukprot:CAMPEP_0168222212 /NCGR_PEP_ID=MMETSP0140_2-20121125/10456_1 /TAXON_ID=44445 /ORGANISM="Pseudo-nitzschia australis, Strain 10249 10 AB" /LENGTH=184 /DNA_ID=CAMNT_0008151611 /DNA_START=273 /DNA_END=824 /DNA_ORIENTATION=+